MYQSKVVRCGTQIKTTFLKVIYRMTLFKYLLYLFYNYNVMMCHTRFVGTQMNLFLFI